MLTLAEQVATDQFQPHNRKADLNEPAVGEDGKVVLIPEVAEALDVLKETGLMAAAMPEEVGGMALPMTISSAIFAWLHGANVGTAAYPMLTAGAINLLIANGSDEQVETWVQPMVEGRFHGTMCLSETQAGSSLSDITTKAVPQDDGTYRVTGNKMWISAGEHELGENIVHLVLAKIPGSPPGVKGISLFIVPALPARRRWRNRRSKRRRSGRGQPQDGLPRNRKHGAELRRGSPHSRWRSRCGRLPDR